MSPLIQFVLYNLLPSMLAGLLFWLLVSLAVELLGIRYSPLRLSLMYAAVVKSLLVLLGLGRVLPWPEEVFDAWQAQAIGWQTVAPYLLIWLGVAILVAAYFRRQAVRTVLSRALPARQAAPRLERSYRRVRQRLQECPTKLTGELVCCDMQQVPNPELLATREAFDSPIAVAADPRPAVLFPIELLDRLSDAELDAALAHELGHLALRSPHWCSPGQLRHLAAIAPISSLLSTFLRREEEKACDDIAVAALGNPEVHADMLLKSYRYAAARQGGLAGRLRALPQLLGMRPMITERVERLLAQDPPQRRIWLQGALACLTWAGMWFLFF